MGGGKTQPTSPALFSTRLQPPWDGKEMSSCTKAPGSAVCGADCPCPRSFSHMCPDTWIGFQSKCYYFSENRSDWNTSLANCKALQASLTSIDSLEELVFINRCKGQGNHWFGLHKEGNSQWRWTNSTVFNDWFEVWGGGNCAYINQEQISSAFCHTEKYWICSRPNNYVLWR
uniref:C-type lectin domain-containing protein n=1 Tax=Anas zonorhyncha TaxID=75864 RepID=A0A8B9V912_9AVES